MRKDAGGADNFGLAFFGNDFFGDFGIEKLSPGFYAVFGGHLGDFYRRIYSQDFPTARLEWSQENAVITANIYNQRIGGKTEAVFDRFGEFFKMCHKNRRSRLHIYIIAK